LHAVFIRAPVVERVGPGVEVLAAVEPFTAHENGAPTTRPDDGAIPVLARQGAVLVSSFHPELTRDRRVHELFVSMIGHGVPGDTGGTKTSRGEGR
jgi:5'-phosphate synthase pdxT subunit